MQRLDDTAAVAELVVVQRLELLRQMIGQLTDPDDFTTVVRHHRGSPRSLRLGPRPHDGPRQSSIDLRAPSRRPRRPSCDRPAHWCDAHHLEPKHDGGADTIDNAALLCRHHHRLIHENGWTLHVDHQNRWVATDRHGIEWTGRPRGHTPRPRHREPAPA